MKGIDSLKFDFGNLIFKDKRIILIGLGVVGREVIAQSKSHGAIVVGIIEDRLDLSERQLNLSGMPIEKYRFSEIQVAISKQAPDYILLAVSLISSEKILNLAQIAATNSIPMLLVPERASFYTEDDTSGVKLGKPTVDDLFARSALYVDFHAIREKLQGKKVFITGGGGSIGSRIAKQALSLGAEKVALFDRDDCLLHDVAVELSGRMHSEHVPIYLGDIQFYKSVNYAVSRFKPDIVVHAAAQKHVTTLEMNPAVAISTNILGTLNVINSCREHSVSEFVNVSTDKAALNNNILGRTKYVSELMTNSLNPLPARSVRFGNVLNSRGSLLRTFEIQAKFSKQITVRGESTSRYFMTADEAASLTLTSLLLGDRGTFVFDMGKSIRISEIAKAYVDQSGHSARIVVEKLLPGESENERLFRKNENPKETSIKDVFRVVTPSMRLDQLGALLQNSNHLFDLEREEAFQLLEEIESVIVE